MLKDSKGAIMLKEMELQLDRLKAKREESLERPE